MTTVFLVVLYMCIYVSIGYMCADVHRCQKRCQGLWRWHSECCEPPDTGGGNQTQVFWKNRKWRALPCTSSHYLTSPNQIQILAEGRVNNGSRISRRRDSSGGQTPAQRRKWCLSTHHHHHLGNISSYKVNVGKLQVHIKDIPVCRSPNPEHDIFKPHRDPSIDTTEQWALCCF